MGSTSRGRLRVYLGAAPGVGKTYAMLSEARRAKERGRDVVVGHVETHGRDQVARLLDGLETVPGRTVVHRGATFIELDTDAVIARRPKAVLVDELAHTNTPGSRHAKRWQDVQDILDAGIDVVSTLNIQHLESLRDVAEQITGLPQRETVPDDLVRRAARIAARTKGADLLAVHVTRADALSTASDPANLARQRKLVEDLGGTYHQVVGDDIPRALIAFADGVNASQLVLGASRRGRLAQLLTRGVGMTTATLSGSIDVHMVPHEAVSGGSGRPQPGGALTRRRKAAGWALTLAAMPALTAVIAPLDLSLPSEILLFLLLVVGVALVGGMWPALTAAVLAFGLLNWFFTPPVHTLTIAEPENVLSLAIFVLVAAMVSTVVDLAARRSREAARSTADAEVLSTLAGHVLRGESAVASLLGRLRETFGLTAVTLLERDDPSGEWRIVATSGGPPITTPPATTPNHTGPDGGSDVVTIDDRLVLATRGRLLDASDRRVLEAFAAEAAVALRQERLREAAERAEPLAEADRMRTALLAAVGHDLRTPLASAMASVESLRNTDIIWSDDDRAELLATAGESLVKLNRLVSNLLDMSRLQAGVLGVALRPVAVEDVLPRAIDDLGPLRDRVISDVPADLPEFQADPALLERVLVNLMANAVRYSPEAEPVLVTASWHGERVELRVIDRGPGIPAEAHERVFMPFQRLGDRDNHTGVGLGLALSRGLTEAMGGTLLLEDTPGGGLTMTVSLRRAL
ncbi:DUF4118 domain-containing protein [Nonomuraea sp. NPDC004702]